MSLKVITLKQDNKKVQDASFLTPLMHSYCTGNWEVEQNPQLTGRCSLSADLLQFTLPEDLIWEEPQRNPRTKAANTLTSSNLKETWSDLAQETHFEMHRSNWAFLSPWFNSEFDLSPLCSDLLWNLSLKFVSGNTAVWKLLALFCTLHYPNSPSRISLIFQDYIAFQACFFFNPC